jgi:hypothetical protein
MKDEEKEKLIEAVADALVTENGSDYSYAELKEHQPAGAKWARELSEAALSAISSAGYVLMPREATLELSNISAEYFGGSYNEWLEMWAALVSSQEGKR